MKPAICLLACAALALAWPVAVSSAKEPSPDQDLLKNPSFEEGEPGAENVHGDLAYHWGRWGNWFNRELLWKPTRNGKCMMGYHHWRIEEESSSGIYQDIPDAPAGANGTFIVRAYQDKGTNLENVELRIEKGGSGDTLASRVYPGKNLPEGSWSKLSVSLTDCPEGGIRVLIIVTPSPEEPREGCLKFDDAELSFE